MKCPRCGASAVEAANFCTACGLSLERGQPEAVPQRRTGHRPEPALLVECPACGARNAASRRRCGRCRAELDADHVEVAAEHVEHADSTPVPRERESSGLLVVVTLVAGLAVLAVLFSLVQARGGLGRWLGPLASGQDATAETVATPDDAEPVEVVAARASSALPAAGGATYSAEQLLDGDPTTAWNEGATGPGVGEWVELDLAEAVPVTRLVVWNGYQRGAAYLENGRVQRLRIEAGDRRFTVGMLDVQGPQAIDLPAPVTADRLRLEISEVYDGARYADAALSEVEVYAAGS